MALEKTLNDCDMIITVAAGRDGEGNEIKDVHKFSKIRVAASDEKIHEVGRAIIDVINHSNGEKSVAKVENYGLMATAE